MKLLDIVSTNRVAFRLTATDKESVLARLVERCFMQDGDNLGLKASQQQTIIDTLKEREALGSTGIGEGVAIPHGKIQGLQSLAAGIRITKMASILVDWMAIEASSSSSYLRLKTQRGSTSRLWPVSHACFGMPVFADASSMLKPLKNYLILLRRKMRVIKHQSL